MSALERPAEVLLVALFDEADRAEAAARAFLHSGLDAGRVAILARDAGGTAFAAVPPGAALRLPGVGRIVARGMLARGIAAGPVGGLGRLATALRRAGLSATDVPHLERALHRGQIVVLAAVPLGEARGWGRLLQQERAVSLRARARLGAWPPEPRPSNHKGGRMLRSTVALAGATLLLSVAAARPARALTDRELIKAHVPFAFRIPGGVMPAGDYELKALDVNDPGVVEIRSTHVGGPAAVFLTIPKHDGSIRQARMVFDDVGKDRFLRAILLPSEKGVELPVARAEVRAAREVAAEATRTHSASQH